MNILIVEDDLLISKYIKKLLAKLGYYVDISNNGIEGIKLIKSHRDSFYNIIIVDLLMPEMDGFTFITESRKLFPDLDYIILSALIDLEKNKENAYKLNVKHHIVKPFKLDDLIKAIKDIKNEKNSVNR